MGTAGGSVGPGSDVTTLTMPGTAGHNETVAASLFVVTGDGASIEMTGVQIGDCVDCFRQSKQK